MSKINGLLFLVGVLMITGSAIAASTSFEDFDRRAREGERLNVVFFGASLTWGANASDPVYTSYRSQFGDWMREYYPKAQFWFWDAAIGGTGSQLGVFRFDRDVMRRKPDLVLLDFSANDDIYAAHPEPSASYESLVRRIVAEANCPVVVMIFPFKWNVMAGKTDGMHGRDSHIAIANAYNAPVGDAITLGIERVAAEEITIDEIWPADGVHPGDKGYELFADAARIAYLDAVERKMVCKAPEEMLHAPTYMKNSRVRISSLTPLPEGWTVGRPNLVAAWYDGLMSRWLDDVAIASNRKQKEAIEPERLKVKFNGSMVLLFGEETTKSGKYRCYLNGELIERQQRNQAISEFDASAKRFGGNRQHAQVIVQGLEPGDYILEIEPIFDENEEQELRIESICVAGGEATVEIVE